MSDAGSILFIDNEDSFVYNLVDAYGARGHSVDVFRCDWPIGEALDYIGEHEPDLVVLSPGPRGPRDAKLCNELLASAPAELPIFGVCLGFQCIVEHFGGSVQATGSPAHGKAAMMTHDDGPMWAGVENPFVAGRYHSLAVARVPDTLRVIARMDEMVMAVRHVSRPIVGVQFHPESVLTPSGQRILDNVFGELCHPEPRDSSRGSERRHLRKVMNSLDALTSLVENGLSLTAAQAAEAMRLIAVGESKTDQTARFLCAMNERRPTVEELVAFVTVLRTRMTRVHAPADNTICNCGTGGDGRGTINISTIAAFVIAACGVPIAKHGNRSVSSRCGSTDCLTALGVRASADPHEAEDLLGEEGLCFLNAPDFHPGLRHAAEARAQLAREGQKSVFNMLGPMLNPAAIRRQSMGVFAEDLVQPIAEALVNTGTVFGYVVWGDGYDELTLTGPSRMATIESGGVSIRTIEPESLGLARCDPQDLIGGDPADNARAAEAILSGQRTGAAAEMVLLNAAAGISAGSTPHVDLDAGLTMAREAVASGGAFDKLRTMRRKAPAHA